MNLQLITDGTDESKFISNACLEAVKAMPWPNLNPDDRPPVVQISLKEPSRKAVIHDIWYCSHPAIAAQTIEDRLHIHDGTEWVKQTPAFEPDLES